MYTTMPAFRLRSPTRRCGRYRGLAGSLFPAAFGNITATEPVEVKPPHCKASWKLAAGQQPEGEGGGKGGGGGRECEYRIGTGALIDAAELCSNPVSCTDEPPLRLVAACHRRPSQLH